MVVEKIHQGSGAWARSNKIRPWGNLVRDSRFKESLAPGGLSARGTPRAD